MIQHEWEKEDYLLNIYNYWEVYTVEKCNKCGKETPFRVLAGRAGFYVGKFCDDCGPVGRATQYLYTRADAEKMLEYVVRITPTVREIAASWPPMYPHGLY